MSMSGEILVRDPVPGRAKRSEELDLDDFFENGAVGLHIVGPDGTILRANQAELQMMGYAAEEYIGRNIAEYHADPDAIADILQRLTRGERLDKYPARLRTKDGSIRDVLITSSARFQDGQFVNTRCFTIDVTEAKKAQDLLAEREAHFAQLLDALPAAIYTTDAKGTVTYFNKAAVEFSGRTPKVGEDNWCVTWRLYSSDGEPLSHDACPMAVALREGRAIRNVEAIAERPDGSRVPFAPYPTPLCDKSGAMTGAVNMLVDISHRKDAERQQALLVRELHHRVKNTLATVQAIMGSTIRYSADMEQFQQAFIGRVAALSKTHSLLTEDKAQAIGFEALLKNELQVFDDGDNTRVSLEGEEINLPAHLAVPVSMAIHELTTNAAKFGSLSALGGTLSVKWRQTGDRLEFTWRERNVPNVKKPKHAGFGSQLLKRVLPQQIGAKLTLRYHNDGLGATFGIPLTAPRLA